MPAISSNLGMGRFPHLEDQKQEVVFGAKSTPASYEHSTGMSSGSKDQDTPQEESYSESGDEDAVYVPFEY